MKKIFLFSLAGMALFLGGCSTADKLSLYSGKTEQVSTPNAEELSQYGEKTERVSSPNQERIYQAPEIGIGSIINDDKNKAIDKWYFLPEGKNKDEYLLVIDDNCLVDAVGFMNGSCMKYFTLDNNKNIIYDGYNGPAIRIHGNILSTKSIQVSNITIVQ